MAQKQGRVILSNNLQKHSVRIDAKGNVIKDSEAKAITQEEKIKLLEEELARLKATQ